MASRPIELPGPITLVPGSRLDSQVRRQAADHPALPVDPRQLVDELNVRTSRGGVPSLFDQPSREGQDWSLLLYTSTCVVRLFLTRYQDAYTIAAITPVRIRDHARLARGCLLLRPAGWRVEYEVRNIPQGSDAFWSQLIAARRQLDDELARVGTPPISREQTRFLDTLDRMIDADERIRTEAARSTTPYPYGTVATTTERRYGTHSVYEFRMAGGRPPPQQGEFVQVRGEPGQRGQVTRSAGTTATVRFDQPIDWGRIPGQGELEVTPSTVVYRKQREAVGLLRTRQAENPHLLPVVVDHRMRPIRSPTAEPIEDLDHEGQSEAFRKSLGVEDLLCVLGPPGTGKTRTITEMSNACARTSGRVLVTSHTNRAVDNVLARLPRTLLAVRVGNEGGVTEEGRPYLLERQAADLREEVLAPTSLALHSYANVEVAGRWAGELGSRLERLGAVANGEAGARHELDAARQAAGGHERAVVDGLAAELQGRQDALNEVQRHADGVAWRRDRAAVRAGWPVLGRLLRARARRYDKRLSVAVASIDAHRVVMDAARQRHAEASRELEAAVRADPGVRRAEAAVAGAVEHRTEARESAFVAARAATAALHEVATPPEVRYEAAPDIAEGDLVALRAWLDGWLPVLAARQRLLREWHDAVSNAGSDQLHPELIRYADVIAATCIGTASRPELSDIDFELAIVDEAGQIGVADVLVPLVRARRGVLVGDHKQLPPFLDSDVQAWGAHVDDPLVRELLANSALERLVASVPDSHTVMLTAQRRMPEAIADFISATFYDGRLRTAVQRDHRDPLFRSPMAFVDTARLTKGRRAEQSGRAREQWGQPGYTNPAEAELLTELAVLYHRRGAEWAIIVPYRAQVDRVRAAVVSEIGDAATVELNVGTVDAFQGGERDVILYGFTRSNGNGNVGFLSELRRANVAFTRARDQLVMVGDSTTLTAARDQGLRDLITSLRGYLAERGDIRQYDEVRDLLHDIAGTSPGGGQ